MTISRKYNSFLQFLENVTSSKAVSPSKNKTKDIMGLRFWYLHIDAYMFLRATYFRGEFLVMLVDALGMVTYLGDRRKILSAKFATENPQDVFRLWMPDKRDYDFVPLSIFLGQKFRIWIHERDGCRVKNKEMFMLEDEAARYVNGDRSNFKDWVNVSPFPLTVLPRSFEPNRSFIFTTTTTTSNTTVLKKRKEVPEETPPFETTLPGHVLPSLAQAFCDHASMEKAAARCKDVCIRVFKKKRLCIDDKAIDGETRDLINKLLSLKQLA